MADTFRKVIVSCTKNTDQSAKRVQFICLRHVEFKDLAKMGGLLTLFNVDLVARNNKDN